jgi:hypothetical protein
MCISLLREQIIALSAHGQLGRILLIHKIVILAMILAPLANLFVDSELIACGRGITDGVS